MPSVCKSVCIQGIFWWISKTSQIQLTVWIWVMADLTSRSLALFSPNCLFYYPGVRTWLDARNTCNENSSNAFLAGSELISNSPPLSLSLFFSLSLWANRLQQLHPPPLFPNFSAAEPRKKASLLFIHPYTQPNTAASSFTQTHTLILMFHSVDYLW